MYRGRAEKTPSRTRLLGAPAFAALLVLILVTHAFAMGQSPPAFQPPLQASPLTAKPKYVVLLILDGAVPSYFKLADFPHIAALIRTGVQYNSAWDGMLESETPTGHASLGTGALPKHHGIISFGWVTDGGQNEQPTNPIPIQQGQLEQILHQSGAPSLAQSLKNHDASIRVVVTSGHKDYAVDSVGGWAADYLLYYMPHGQNWVPTAIPRHVPPQSVLSAAGLTAYAPHMAAGDQDSLAVQLALSAFRQIHQRVTVINLPEFDWPLGHLQGGRADTYHAWQLMSRLDADIASIEWEYHRAGVLGQTLFVLTADHGMVTLNHTVSHDAIQNAVRAAGTTLTDYEFHTAGYLWIRDRNKAGGVAASILKLHNRYIKAVYYREPGSYVYVHAPGGSPLAPGVDGAYRFLLSTFAGPTAPHVAIFLAENTSILGRNQTGWRGDHGGPSWNAEHIPLILSGAGVRRDKTSTYPATIYDVAPTIVSLMGGDPSPMDGVPLADGLLQPSESELQAQRERGKQLTPYVQALIAQSKLDGP